MPHVYSEVNSLENQPKVGDRQCVALIQHYLGGPQASHWQAGDRALDTLTITPGTAIATFVSGHYPNFPHGNHAAFFLRRDGDCIWMMDQCVNDHTKLRISSRRICRRGQNKDGSYQVPVDNADAYSVIEW